MRLRGHTRAQWEQVARRLGLEYGQVWLLYRRMQRIRRGRRRRRKRKRGW